MSAAKGHTAEDRTLWLIGGFKLIKGLLLLVVGFGALHLLHKDIEDVTAAWATHLHLDAGNRYVDAALGKLLSLDDRKLKAISAGTFFYAALLSTEGTGLLLRKRWAEYFTIIVTGSFIPLELYELVRRVTVPRVVFLVINVAVVWYLVVVLRRHKGEKN